MLLLGVVAWLALFVGASLLLHPGGSHFSVEVVLLRALGIGALLLLHLVLAIGPLSRLDPRWLPLLANRRHMGVTTFALGAAHGLLATLFYGGFGVRTPAAALLDGYDGGGTLTGFPFETLGFLALVALFALAATSHDFWLATLGHRAWKSIHMSVYPAYLLLVGHVALGALQSERALLPALLLGAGAATLGALHAAAAMADRARQRRVAAEPGTDGWVDAGDLAALADGRARLVHAPGHGPVAVFRHGDRAWGLANVCAHQGGPLGEGRIIDGCVTCPWHGWQYRPDDGRSPPPFSERIPTHAMRLHRGRVQVQLRALPPGTPRPPAAIPASEPRP